MTYSWYCGGCGGPDVRSNDREAETAGKVRTDRVLEREAEPALTIHHHRAHQTAARWASQCHPWPVCINQTMHWDLPASSIR